MVPSRAARTESTRLLVSPSRVEIVVTATLRKQSMPSDVATQMLFSRSSGVYRIYGGEADRFSSADGLSSDSVIRRQKWGTWPDSVKLQWDSACSLPPRFPP